ncbi:hypothetical protein RND71_015670 [Anisodus tanguticus]|uniref:C2H2-type domain-containing protein n=1 Tax=Anisodus tanguticus TaxID=243964 RepID=A0AAE1VD30_9SOLA|nr:hypothetical protein RND71_015670 [Anisodus tanguticus]
MEQILRGEIQNIGASPKGEDGHKENMKIDEHARERMKKISMPMWLLHCPICDQIVRGFQNFMHHVQSHPIDEEEETYIVEGSSRRNVPLPRPSESVQHVRTIRDKRGKSQSSPLPPLFRPPSFRGISSDNVNKQLPPPLPPSPPSYLARSLRGSDNGRGVLLNQQLPPLPQLYHPTSLRGNNHSRGVQDNQPKQFLQSTRTTNVQGSNSIAINLNEPAPDFMRQHIKELDFSILDRSDSSQLKFKPQLTCDNKTNGLDLCLKL